MKATLFCILLVLSGILSAQTIDNPPFKARSGSISNITRIERTPESTRVYIHAIFRPHWWIKEKGTSYLEDATTGKKYKVYTDDIKVRRWIESGEIKAGDLVVVEYEGEISSNYEVKGAYSIFTGTLEENGILNQE